MSNNRLVYSDTFGRICPNCSQPVKHCCCRKQQEQTPPKDGVIRIQRETKGRKGKGVTLITGLPLNSEELKKMAKLLKQRCGTGGTVKDGVVEIQGDHRDLLYTLLMEQGYRVKKAGG
jgi:translation initiation factor 1